MKKFQKLCESLSVIKKTTIIRYPKQIQLSEEFRLALDKEIQRFATLIEESKQPINNLTEKFVKALRFHVVDLLEKRISNVKRREQKLKPIMQRLKSIQRGEETRKEMPPPTKIERPEKGSSYKRSEEKEKFRKALED